MNERTIEQILSNTRRPPHIEDAEQLAVISFGAAGALGTAASATLPMRFLDRARIVARNPHWLRILRSDVGNRYCGTGAARFFVVESSRTGLRFRVSQPIDDAFFAIYPSIVVDAGSWDGACDTSTCRFTHFNIDFRTTVTRESLGAEYQRFLAGEWVSVALPHVERAPIGGTQSLSGQGPADLSRGMAEWAARPALMISHPLASTYSDFIAGYTWWTP